MCHGGLLMTTLTEPLDTWRAATVLTQRRVRSTAMKAWRRPAKVSTTEWANKHRVLSAEETARPGRYSDELTPWVRGMQDALDDPEIWKVVCMKSAQVAWTTVLNNWIGRTMHSDPSPVVGMFSKEASAKEYREEKLRPMCEATRVLSDLIDVSSSRKAGNRWSFMRYPGGFLKLVGSNSPSNVKSTPAPRVFVEEPDDSADNVGKQGDAIKLLEERTKTYSDRKVVFGGTPSVKGLSNIESSYLASDQRKFFVPCHDCGESHVLHWDNVSWTEEQSQSHEVYGKAVPSTAVYVCPCCGSLWDDYQRVDNVRKAEWVATAKSNGVAGFYINELYSPWKASRMPRLVERYLEATRLQEMGEETEMIVFVNSCLGLPYEFRGERLDTESLKEKALDYEELIIPAGGIVLTAGIDIQHDRIAIIIRAWGRGEESWLIYWGEIYGNTIDKSDPVWGELLTIISRTYAMESGGVLRLSATSVDSSDGVTSDAVYSFVRSHSKKMPNLMAIKGSSNDYGAREIFSRPKASIDSRGKRNTKAAKYGLRPFIVGTHKAKDLIHGRMNLEGNGPGRMHWYKSVRPDYLDQMTGEVKAPHRSMRGKRVWQQKSGAAVEAWDCEVYALHAARSARVHLLSDKEWDAIEARVNQVDLFTDQADDSKPQQFERVTQKTTRGRKNGGFVKSWRN
ncbi:MAG: phage terminase large subunit family protein [Gammaproteobacteria bacterium]|nr:MAG: phage terminase large subunit family protein [Gammaproteobacteria bacterium]